MIERDAEKLRDRLERWLLDESPQANQSENTLTLIHAAYDFAARFDRRIKRAKNTECPHG